MFNLVSGKDLKQCSYHKFELTSFLSSVFKEAA